MRLDLRLVCGLFLVTTLSTNIAAEKPDYVTSAPPLVSGKTRTTANLSEPDVPTTKQSTESPVATDKNVATNQTLNIAVNVPEKTESPASISSTQSASSPEANGRISNAETVSTAQAITSGQAEITTTANIASEVTSQPAASPKKPAEPAVAQETKGLAEPPQQVAKTEQAKITEKVSLEAEDTAAAAAGGSPARTVLKHERVTLVTDKPRKNNTSTRHHRKHHKHHHRSRIHPRERRLLRDKDLYPPSSDSPSTASPTPLASTRRSAVPVFSPLDVLPLDAPEPSPRITAPLVASVNVQNLASNTATSTASNTTRNLLQQEPVPELDPVLSRLEQAKQKSEDASTTTKKVTTIKEDSSTFATLGVSEQEKILSSMKQELVEQEVIPVEQQTGSETPLLIQRERRQKQESPVLEQRVFLDMDRTEGIRKPKQRSAWAMQQDRRRQKQIRDRNTEQENIPVTISTGPKHEIPVNLPAVTVNKRSAQQTMESEGKIHLDNIELIPQDTMLEQQNILHDLEPEKRFGMAEVSVDDFPKGFSEAFIKGEASAGSLPMAMAPPAAPGTVSGETEANDSEEARQTVQQKPLIQMAPKSDGDDFAVRVDISEWHKRFVEDKRKQELEKNGDQEAKDTVIDPVEEYARSVSGIPAEAEDETSDLEGELGDKTRSDLEQATNAAARMAGLPERVRQFIRRVRRCGVDHGEDHEKCLAGAGHCDPAAAAITASTAAAVLTSATDAAAAALQTSATSAEPIITDTSTGDSKHHERNLNRHRIAKQYMLARMVDILMDELESLSDDFSESGQAAHEDRKKSQQQLLRKILQAVHGHDLVHHLDHQQHESEGHVAGDQDHELLHHQEIGDHLVINDQHQPGQPHAFVDYKIIVDSAIEKIPPNKQAKNEENIDDKKNEADDKNTTKIEDGTKVEDQHTLINDEKLYGIITVDALHDHKDNLLGDHKPVDHHGSEEHKVDELGHSEEKISVHGHELIHEGPDENDQENHEEKKQVDIPMKHVDQEIVAIDGDVEQNKLVSKLPEPVTDSTAFTTSQPVPMEQELEQGSLEQNSDQSGAVTGGGAAKLEEVKTVTEQKEPASVSIPTTSTSTAAAVEAEEQHAKVEFVNKGQPKILPLAVIENGEEETIKANMRSKRSHPSLTGAGMMGAGDFLLRPHPLDDLPTQQFMMIIEDDSAVPDLIVSPQDQEQGLMNIFGHRKPHFDDLPFSHLPWIQFPPNRKFDSGSLVHSENEPKGNEPEAEKINSRSDDSSTQTSSPSPTDSTSTPNVVSAPLDNPASRLFEFLHSRIRPWFELSSESTRQSPVDNKQRQHQEPLVPSFDLTIGVDQPGQSLAEAHRIRHQRLLQQQEAARFSYWTRSLLIDGLAIVAIFAVLYYTLRKTGLCTRDNTEPSGDGCCPCPQEIVAPSSGKAKNLPTVPLANPV